MSGYVCAQEKAEISLIVNSSTAQDDSHPSCNHWPPMVVIIPTEHGCKARCLTCGQTGPEGQDTDQAWTALMRSPRKSGGKVDAPGAFESYGRTGTGNR